MKCILQGTICMQVKQTERGVPQTEGLKACACLAYTTFAGFAACYHSVTQLPKSTEGNSWH